MATPAVADNVLQVLSQVVLVPPEELQEAEWNPQDHTPESTAKVKASIRQFGFVSPILVRQSDSLVVGGHGRLKAVAELIAEGFVLPDGCVPVLYGEWDDATLMALNVALNHIQASPDEQRLGAVLARLKETYAYSLKDLKVTGIPRDGLNRLIQNYQSAVSNAVAGRYAGGPNGGAAEFNGEDLVPPGNLQIADADLYRRYIRYRAKAGVTDDDFLIAALDVAEAG